LKLSEVGKCSWQAMRLGGKSQPRQERKEGHFPTIESWNDADCKLEVTQPEGWMCRVRLQTKIHLPPDELYDLLTQPDNSGVFRNIKALTSRKIIEDDHRGRQVIDIEQEAKWRFLCFGGTFSTKLFVHQNKPAREIMFKLKESGMMKRFEGTWHIKPFNQQALDESFGFNSRKGQHWTAGPVHALQGFHRRVRGGSVKEAASLLTLEQSVCPNAVPPKALEGILKGIAARQVRNLVEDVRREVDKRNAEKERDKPHPSTSGAPLASMSLGLRSRFVMLRLE